ncbi:MULTISPECIES: S8 family serine peptidase [unclassified Streptomyces]|uniref:S8 family peptidase n=1 Tax=unclassified Streptomyces TaxID=2593676 RepID=UPI002E190551|nr:MULTISPECIES: S8 family serine peptidase [unclassified Streptomyces]
MRFAHRTLRAIGGAAMVGALVLGTAAAASADATRDGQWQNKAFDIDAIHKVATGKGVTVAVLDDSVNGSQADLTGNVLPGKRCKDGQPANVETVDDHGTGMASLIAGHGHGSGNSQGLLGMAPDAKILPVDVFATEGGAVDQEKKMACTEPEAIRYAVDQGADIISMSLGQGFAGQDSKEAAAYALAHNVVLVISSGNDGVEDNGGLGSVPGVVQVGASTQNGTPWEDSTYSKRLLFTAPGKDITVATSDGKYEDADGNSQSADYLTSDGSSMSAAIASGAFALLKQKYPDYTPGQLANRITKSTYIAKGVDKSKLPDKYHGYGDLSPLKALTANIPKGDANGPWDLSSLPKASGKDKAAGSSSGTEAASDSSDSGSSNVFLYVGIGIAALVVIVVVIVLVTRNKNNRGGPGGPGGPGAPGTMPPHAYQQGGYPPQPQQPGPYGQQQPPQWGPPRQ